MAETRTDSANLRHRLVTSVEKLLVDFQSEEGADNVSQNPPRSMVSVPTPSTRKHMLRHARRWMRLVANGTPAINAVGPADTEYPNREERQEAQRHVDVYSASTYDTIGIDIDLFTPVFAVSRIS
jgi:hypothetical protein